MSSRADWHCEITLLEPLTHCGSDTVVSAIVVPSLGKASIVVIFFVHFTFFTLYSVHSVNFHGLNWSCVAIHSDLLYGYIYGLCYRYRCFSYRV